MNDHPYMHYNCRCVITVDDRVSALLNGIRWEYEGIGMALRMQVCVEKEKYEGCAQIRDRLTIVGSTQW